MLKIKVAFGQDLRLFKFQGAVPSEAFDALNTFVSETFNVEQFRLQYEDEENDLITVSSRAELDEAFEFAVEQGKTPKLFVVAIVAQETAVVSPPASEEKSEIPHGVPVTETNHAAANVEPAQEAGDGWQSIHGLKQLLVEDEGFRQEFSAFAQDVVLQLRDGDDFQTAFQTGLAAHDELAEHPFVRDTFVPMLPIISEKAALFTPMLKNIEPTAVPGLIDQAVASLRNGENMLPMMMQMMASGGMGGGTPGGFPPFGVGGSQDPRTGAFGGFPFGGAPQQESGGHGPWNHPHGFGRGWGGRGRGWRGRGGGRGWQPHGHGGFHQANPPSPNDSSSAPQAPFLADVVDESVTLVDGAVVLPGSSVVKTWKIRNTGEGAYPEGTKLKYVGRPFNELVDGAEFPVESVTPGDEGEISVLLSTPHQAGRFGSSWRLHLPDGTPFGPMLQARVLVANQGVQPTLAVEDADGMGDIYDAEPDADGDVQLEDMVAEQARLQADLAVIGSQIDASRVEDERPIVSTLPMSTPGNENSAVDDVGPSAEPTEPDTFVQELEELSNMGFDDLQLNRMLLTTHNGELNVVLNLLCELRA